MGHSKVSAKRYVHSNTGLPKNHRNISKKESNPTSTGTGGTRTKPKSNRRKEIIKIRDELNDKEIKRTIQRINKSRSWFFEKINKIDKPSTRVIN